MIINSYLVHESAIGESGIGNYWGRDCPTGPFFISGNDSNALDVVDSSPLGIPVAGLVSVPTPPGCV